MELVRGIRITEYCDQANLSTTDRLQIFKLPITGHYRKKGTSQGKREQKSLFLTRAVKVVAQGYAQEDYCSLV